MRFLEMTVDRQASLHSALSAASPQIGEVVRALPQNFLDQLTFDEFRRFVSALNQPRARHILDYRLSVPIGSRRFYVRLLCGRERRKKSRLITEGQTNPWLFISAAALLFWFMMTISLMFAVAILYLTKSAIGIDLFDGPSFLHRLFFDF